MRVRIVFKLKNKGAVLPFHHQGLIRSVLDLLVGGEYDLDNTPFNYSGLKGQTKVGREGLHYYSRLVTLVFTSSDEQLIQKIIERIFRLEQLYLGNLNLAPELVEQETSSTPDKQECKYLCISPIVILNSSNQLQNKIFTPPASEEFSELLMESTKSRMEAHGHYLGSLKDGFEVTPDKVYINKMVEKGKKIARIYTLNSSEGSTEVRGYTFPFLLKANADVHKFIFKNGFGELTQHGFGMVDLTSAKNAPREVIYKKGQSGGLLGNR